MFTLQQQWCYGETGLFDQPTIRPFKEILNYTSYLAKEKDYLEIINCTGCVGFAVRYQVSKCGIYDRQSDIGRPPEIMNEF
jgi:hypothetical protein